MLAMTMPFEVSDSALLEGLAAGQNIDFVIALENGVHRVVSVSLAHGHDSAPTRPQERALASPDQPSGPIS